MKGFSFIERPRRVGSELLEREAGPVGSECVHFTRGRSPVAIRTPKLSLFQAHDNSCFRRMIVIIGAARDFYEAEALVKRAGGDIRFADL